MAEIIELEVITPAGFSLKSQIQDLYIPAFYGEAGILSNHLPYVSVLNTGEVSFLELSGKRHYLFIKEGFLEVRNNRIIIVADGVIRGEELPISELERRLAESEQRVKSAFSGQITPEQLEQELVEQRVIRLQLAIGRQAEKAD